MGVMPFIHQSMPPSTFVVTPAGSNGFMWEVPEQFKAAMIAFLT
jgi:pimeloyl-ACP methyl ester carboxylesterase